MSDTYYYHSVGATVRCGFWPVEQYPSIFFSVSRQLSPSSHSQHLNISFYFLVPSFPGPSPSSCPFQFLGEDLIVYPILLHSLQVTKPTQPLPFYPFYNVFSIVQLFKFLIRPAFPLSIFVFRAVYSSKYFSFKD